MRRLNVKLLAILLSSACVLAVGLYFLWKYQVSSNADYLVEQAKSAESEGNYERAVDLLAKYVRLTGFEPDGMAELASVAVRWTESSDAPIIAYQKAYGLLEQTLQLDPDNHEIRRKVIDYQLSPIVNQPRDARRHIELLLPDASAEEKPELDVLMAICLAREEKTDEAVDKLAEVLGYETLTKSFDSSRATAPDHVDAYYHLATLLETRLDDTNGADIVIEKLTERIPDDFKAHYYSGRFNYTYRKDDLDQAMADLYRARNLLPEDVDKVERLNVLISLADVARDQEKYGEASQILEQAAAEFPDSERIIDARVKLAMTEGGERLDDALVQIEKGLEKHPDSAALLWLRANLLVYKQDLDGVRKIIRHLNEKNVLGRGHVGFLEAQVQFAEQNWRKAAELFEKVRPSMPDPDLQIRIDTQLAQCYRQLGRLELSLKAWERVLAANPTNVAAALGISEVKRLLGDTSDAEKMLTRAGQLQPDAGGPVATYVQSGRLRVALSKQQQVPESRRDWTEVNKIVEQMLPGLSEMQQAVLKADILGYQGETDEAAAILADARQSFPDEIAVWITSANVALRAQKPDEATQLLETASQTVGDSAVIRQAMAGAIVGRDGEKATEELHELEKGLDDFSAAERRAVLTRLGTLYMALNNLDDAKRVWNEIAKEHPDDPTIRMGLFDLARASGDLKMMQEALEDIESVLGKESAEWKVARGAMLLQQAVTDKNADRGGLLGESRKHLVSASEVRPQWDKPYRFLAEIDGIQGRLAESIDNLEKVMLYNPGDTSTASKLLVLLASVRDFKRAEKYVASVGPGPHTMKFKKLIAEIHEQNGKVDAAVAMAKEAVPADSPASDDHIWKGALFTRLDRPKEAESTYRDAIRQDPSRTGLWLVLVEHMVKNGNSAQVPTVISDATKRIPPAHATMLTAQALDMFGRNLKDEADEARQAGKQSEATQKMQEAQKRITAAAQKFAEAAQQAPNDILVARALAVHHANEHSYDEMHLALDRIISLESTADENELPQVHWARRIKAQHLASSKEYPKFRESIDLLEANRDADGQMTMEDTLIKAQLLAMRPEPSLWSEAMETFEKLSTRRPLTVPEKYTLARLYSKAGKPEKARQAMFEVLASAANNKEYVTTYIDMLLDQGDFNQAGSWIQKLMDLEPNSLMAYVAGARLLDEQGQPENAKKMIGQLVNGLSDDKVKLYLPLAAQCARLEFYDMAEKLYRDAVAKDPSLILALAAYLAERGEFDEAFKIFGQAVTAQPSAELLDGVSFRALIGIHMNRDKVSRHHFDQVENWVKQGLVAAPNSPVFLVRLADIYDLQGNTQEVVKRYEALLERDDLDAVTRATVMNNLAYVYALQSQRTDDAKKLIEEAISVIGPSADLLDTRALIHLVANEPQQALSDLELATLGNNDGAKLFHLAWAYEANGQRDKAREKLRLALDSGLTESRLASAELDHLKRLRQQLLGSGR